MTVDGLVPPTCLGLEGVGVETCVREAWHPDGDGGGHGVPDESDVFASGGAVLLCQGWR